MNFPKTNCGYCNNLSTVGCEVCNPTGVYKVTPNHPDFDNPHQHQLDRIEQKLDQLLERKKPSKPRKVNADYPDWFEDMWIEYPKRAGANPKGKAMSAVSARLAQNNKLYDSEFICGAHRYALYCDATHKTGTEYVMQAATFFGPDKHYENDWTIPKMESAPTLPKENDDLETWAKANGHRTAYVGETYPAYRNYLQGKLR